MPRGGILILVVALSLVVTTLAGCQRQIESHPLKAEILQLALDGQDPDLTLQLKAGIAVIADPPSVPSTLAKVYRTAETPGRVQLGAGKAWVIVSAGPLLDSPDTVRVQKAALDGHTFRIGIVHTSARLHGDGLRRNRPWRPLLLLPIEPPLSPGEYQVAVSWQALESLPAGKELAPPQLLGPLSFTVVK